VNAASRLASFQDAFAHSLFALPPDAHPLVSGIVRQPAFAVYRNTVMKGCVDALQANFPAVARLVGEDWFRAAAAEHVAHRPPTEPTLLTYGDAFPSFLSTFAPAADLPYLADVARLDRLWTEAHGAADDPVIAPRDFMALDPEALAGARLQPHRATRWAWFADTPIYSIWSRNRDGDGDGSAIEWAGEGALLTRPDGVVMWRPLDEAGGRFLDACARELTVQRAMEAALEVDAEADLVALISNLIEAGAISRIIQGP